MITPNGCLLRQGCEGEVRRQIGRSITEWLEFRGQDRKPEARLQLVRSLFARRLHRRALHRRRHLRNLELRAGLVGVSAEACMPEQPCTHTQCSLIRYCYEPA